MPPLAVAAILLALLYWRIVWGMAGQWASDPDYSHGFLVPVISGYFFWEKRQQVGRLQLSPNLLGLGVIIFGLALLLAGSAGGEFYAMRSSLIIFLAGIVLYWFGWEIILNCWRCRSGFFFS